MPFRNSEIRDEVIIAGRHQPKDSGIPGEASLAGNMLLSCYSLPTLFNLTKKEQRIVVPLL
jgi:hypothetical protein